MSGSLSYLLGTNILSDLIRNPGGVVAARISRVGEDSVCTSIDVAAELRYGALKSTFAKLSERVDLILSVLEILPLETPADREYAALRDHLVREGIPIGPNELLMAAHALAQDLTVVTGNVLEFSRVPGLKVQDWLAPGFRLADVVDHQSVRSNCSTGNLPACEPRAIVHDETA